MPFVPLSNTTTPFQAQLIPVMQRFWCDQKSLRSMIRLPAPIVAHATPSTCAMFQVAWANHWTRPRDARAEISFG